MNKYELVYVIDTALDDDARKVVIDRFNGMIEQEGGKVLKVDEWGKRRLAYPIDYKTEGWYVLVNVSSEATLPLELERNLKINDMVIRYQVIRVLERKVGIKPRAPRPQPAAVSQEEPAAEEAEQPAEAQEAPESVE